MGDESVRAGPEIVIDDVSNNRGTDNDHEDDPGTVQEDRASPILDGSVIRPGDEEAENGRFISDMEIRLGAPGPRDLTDFVVVDVVGRSLMAGLILTVWVTGLIMIVFTGGLKEERSSWRALVLLFALVLLILVGCRDSLPGSRSVGYSTWWTGPLSGYCDL
jgi:hypothetical protein